MGFLDHDLSLVVQSDLEQDTLGSAIDRGCHTNQRRRPELTPGECGTSLRYLGRKPSTPELRVQCEADLDLTGPLDRQVPQDCAPDKLGPSPLPEYPDAEPVFHPVFEVSGEVLGRLFFIPDASEFDHDVWIAVKLDQTG